MYRLWHVAKQGSSVHCLQKVKFCMSQLQKIAGTIAALGWTIVSIMETIVQPKAATLANCIC